MADPIRILLVDDHMVVRAGLAQVIGARDSMCIVGEADNGEEALFLCHKLSPDIVLMDVKMRGMGGIGATEAIGRYHPEVRVIGLSTFHDPQTVGQMMAAGARGFLSKTLSADELIDAILRVHDGETVVADAFLPAAQPDDVPCDEPLVLGAQQKRVLALLTKGYTNADIAAYLNISLPTARYHVSAILVKLGVANRAEAAAMAVREKLIDNKDL